MGMKLGGKVDFIQQGVINNININILLLAFRGWVIPRSKRLLGHTHSTIIQ